MSHDDSTNFVYIGHVWPKLAKRTHDFEPDVFFSHIIYLTGETR